MFPSLPCIQMKQLKGYRTIYRVSKWNNWKDIELFTEHHASYEMLLWQINLRHKRGEIRLVWKDKDIGHLSKIYKQKSGQQKIKIPQQKFWISVLSGANKSGKKQWNIGLQYSY